MSALWSTVGTLLFLFAVGVVLASYGVTRRRIGLACGAVAVAIAFVLPVGGLTAFQAARTLFDTPSAAFLVLVAFSLAAFLSQRAVVTAGDEAAFCGIVVIVGALVYASALGIVSLDFYRFGYSTDSVVILPSALLVVAGLTRSLLSAVWAGLASASWLLKAVDSVNFFDHLVDVPTWSVAVIMLMLHGWSAATSRPVPIPGLRTNSRTAPRRKRGRRREPGT